METIKRKIKSALNYLKVFVKWGVISIIVGIAGGLIGTAFHKSVDLATEVRSDNSWLIYLLPLGGILIALLYKLCKLSNIGTNRVIESVRTGKKVSILMAPLIFVSTVITHLLGGSAGREGAALQLGGSIGYRFGRIFRLDDKDMALIVMIGMSSVFSALFGTPLTATLFALEVISVGVIYYVALVPCLLSALSAYKISMLFNVQPVSFSLAPMSVDTSFIFIRVSALAILCALVSILFCTAVKKGEHYAEKLIKNDYTRAFAGGILIVLLTVILRTNDYNGAGMNIIIDAILGNAHPEAFLLKIIFTAITIAAGFKGGEIVPAFFIGSTFGCTVAPILGIDPSFGAAIGFVSLFCGVVNCPVASIFLALEVFGADYILAFAVACGVSYMMSGYYGLYSSQKIMYSKLEAKYININAK